jgi:hypothetical protein
MRHGGGWLVALAGLLVAAGCASTPRGRAPTYEYYWKLAGQGVMAPIEAEEGNDDSGPEPGLAFTVGLIDVVSYDDAWGVEGTLERSFPTLSGGTGGVYTRYLVGLRHAWDLDQKLKQAFRFGFAWHSIRFSDTEADYSIVGFGLYFGYGVEFAISERWTLGAGATLHGWRGKNDFNRDFELSTIFDVGLSYYF